MHGEFPFPEATASTEVLMAGEAGGEQATVLVKSGGIAGSSTCSSPNVRPLARDLLDERRPLRSAASPTRRSSSST